VALQYNHGGLGQAPLVPLIQLTQPPTLAFPAASDAVSVTYSQDPEPSHRLPKEDKWLGNIPWGIESSDRASEQLVSVPVVNVANTDESLVEGEMKQVKTKTIIGILSTLISYVSLNSWHRARYPDAFSLFAEDAEEATWVASSKSWIDRKSCRWLSICGGSHLKSTGSRFGHHVHNEGHESAVKEDDSDDWRDAWTDGIETELKNSNNTIVGTIPDYVIEYAPLVHLFSGEQYWPCDMAEHLYHITPMLNYTPIQSEYQHPQLKNLDKLNKWPLDWVYLTSNDDVEERPEWLEGVKNIPVPPQIDDDDFSDNDGWVHHPGRTYMQDLKDAAQDLKDWYGSGDHTWDDEDAFTESKEPRKAYEKHLQEAKKYLHEELKRFEDDGEARPNIRGGRSDAPAILIVVDKGHGIVDAFWFFFYSFNLGNSVFNIRFGNHVGDWEHTAIRFHHGTPKAVYFSEHSFGSAYGYEAVEKLGKRPIIYSATGTHAMYATAGSHPYILPWGILHDQTDKGPLWDPALNSHAYVYDYKNDTLRASTLTPKAPTGWFHFAGHWGDKFYPLGDKRQYRFAGQYHYVNGPLGPKFKNLARKKICGGPDTEPCIIKHWLGGSMRVKRWQSNGEEADPFSAAALA
jgi:hypothetical protein